MLNDFDYLYENENYIKKLNIYTDNFTKENLLAYEDRIFSPKISRKKRAELEIERLIRILHNDVKEYANYYKILIELSKMLKVADLSSDILDDIYKIIVMIQLNCNISVRLYSGIAMIKDEEEIRRLQKMAGDSSGKKYNR